MTPCEFAGRHSPPPGHDGLANYACTICAADVRPRIITEVPRQAETPAPSSEFRNAIRFVVEHDGDKLPPGDYIVQVGEPNRLTGYVPLRVVRCITDDRK